MLRRIVAVLAGGMALATAASAEAQDDATELAKKTQNPVSNLISVPLQNNFNFNTGPFNRLQYTGLLQPVVPLGLTDDWNVIVRPILPFVNQPIGPGGSVFGLGDASLQTYFTPKHSGSFTWGIGPVGQFPTRTDPALGNGMWGAGLGGVALVQPGPWVIGALVNHVWSIGTPASDQSSFSITTLQPFVNYNFGKGLAAGVSSQTTRDGSRIEGQQWTVPLGVTVSQVVPIGHQPVQFTAGAFYNVARPTNASEWQLRFQLTFLFPK